MTSEGESDYILDLENYVLDLLSSNLTAEQLEGLRSRLDSRYSDLVSEIRNIQFVLFLLDFMD